MMGCDGCSRHGSSHRSLLCINGDGCTSHPQSSYDTTASERSPLNGARIHLSAKVRKSTQDRRPVKRCNLPDQYWDNVRVVPRRVLVTQRCLDLQ